MVLDNREWKDAARPYRVASRTGEICMWTFKQQRTRLIEVFTLEHDGECWEKDVGTENEGGGSSPSVADG
jgi:hypothetical protein